MKKQNVLVLILIFVSIQFMNADNIDFSVGGGITAYIIPTFNYSNIETTILQEPPLVPVRTTEVTTAENLNLLFGFTATVPIVVTYHFNNGWGVGGTVELGYSFQGGPHVYLRNAPSDYVPTDTAYMFHAFYGVFNFTAKTPVLKYDFRIMMEIGLILRGGGLLRWDRNSHIRFPLGSGETDVRALCYVGPDIFVGFQKNLTSSLIIMPGIRMSTEFAYFDNNSYQYRLTKEFYLQANIGLEFRLMWNKIIPVSSSSSGTKKSNTTNKNKSKSNNNNDDKEDFK